MHELLATPDAVKDFLAARDALFRAFKFDQDHGVSANRIASMADGVISRPVLLRILNSEQAKADAIGALKERGIDSYVNVALQGGSGWGATHACLHLALDPIEMDPALRQTLFTDVVAALGGVGLSLGDATTEDLWDGEELPISVRETAT